MVQKIDYELLIDPLCRESIRILREELDIETLYCCQGKCQEDRISHSTRGYIVCVRTDFSRMVIRRLLEVIKRIKNDNNLELKFPKKYFKRDGTLKTDLIIPSLSVDDYKGTPRICIHFFRMEFLPKEFLKYVWNEIEKELKIIKSEL